MRYYTVYGLLLCFSLLSISLQAQRTISGTISNSKGELLIGATVSAKGTSIGTTTDVDGNYTLEVPEETKTLLFSYLGFEAQEINLGASNLLDIVLQLEALVFDEVIITGYSTELKREITAAITSVKNNEI